MKNVTEVYSEQRYLMCTAALALMQRCKEERLFLWRSEVDGSGMS